MFFGQIPPQLWVSSPPNDKSFAFQSPFHGCGQRSLVPRPFFYPGPQEIYSNNLSLSSLPLSQSHTQQPEPEQQQQQRWTMDDKSAFDHLADRGDDPYMHQQQQDNKESMGVRGNDPMFWPNNSLSASSNAIPTHQCLGGGDGGGGGASIEQRSGNYGSWQGYHYGSAVAAVTAGANQHFDYHDGLPNPSWDPNSMSVLGEPFECDHISPTSTFRSFSSSTAASDAMRSLSLAPMQRGEDAPSDSRMGNSSTDSWTYPSTISPKQLLRINPSPTPNSSSESVHTALLACDNSEFNPPRQRNSALPSKQHHSSSKGRRELPNKPKKSGPELQPASSQGAGPSSDRGATRHHHHHHHHNQQQQQQQQNLPILKPRPEGSSLPGAATPASQTVKRSDKDEFLIRSRELGMSYREIRQRGGFVEAESTLRGRLRNLTKAKEARVRKPQWQDKDIQLLKKAVHKLARGRELSSAKIPWKEVAQYIFDHGGSYLFGNATCRKRWDDLVLRGEAA
ncbi:hypothetical protein SLS62_009723 [Diatrype stigma]|uniref:Myb-like domain-containing protein n=1 Tax=Diatrype stigma TaxID=117547 RepID=A0AAN9UFS5_9PEZI